MLAGFLPHPGHQEDVVVDAQGDEEDKDEQRERVIRVAEVEHVVEEQRAHAQRRGVRQHHGGDQHDRCYHRAQQQPQHQEHQDQDDGDDHVSVVVRP